MKRKTHPTRKNPFNTDNSRKRNPAGTKRARKAAKGHLSMSNPGGLFSEYYRNVAKERRSA